ncbi:unnamed protein product [Trifolium pratense]|uniref:Uncharacterized protein n=1 Tax=Trifolium pratense TaxID=57577 RepID=A0ACB0JQB1_TRIPR|nr:unnamed protein product [Trifolium pratense]
MASAFSAELCGFMTAIEIADARGWRNMWIESDSMLVVNAYKSSNIVPWSLSNRWFNCIKLAGHMNIIVSHIFREGNHCADRLANVGLNLDKLTLWNDIPFVIKDSFESNRLVVRIRGCDGGIRRSEDLRHEEFLRRQAEEQQEEEELVPEVPPVVQPVVWPGGPIDTSLLTRYHEHVARHVWFGEVINFYL